MQIRMAQQCDIEGDVYKRQPDIMGKEKRKVKPSAEGKLGVEGVEKNIILDVYKRQALNRQANVIESLKYGIWYSVSLTVTETVTMLKWKPRILIPVWGLKDLLVQFRELIICSRLTQSRI